MAALTYNPDVFRVRSEREAREIILTTEGGLGTDVRWARETPHLTDLFASNLNVSPGQVVVDFGCGVGRMSRALIERLGCRVLGVDISVDMRAFAPGYVNSEDFSVVSAAMFKAMVDGGFRADAAISVWVIQHCLEPAKEIDLLKTSLKAGGRLGIVNNNRRAVPTKEKAWASDGIDVRGLLRERFPEIEAGQLDPAVVTEHLAGTTFWAIYQRD
jgi:cyclopropane fatty-acyl-phospholipid synthase-like methyltransferase